MSQQVRYLGLILTPGERKLSPERVWAIPQRPYPTTKKQHRTFHGLLGYCRLWLIGCELNAQPLYEALKRNKAPLSGARITTSLELLKKKPCWFPSLSLRNPIHCQKTGHSPRGINARIRPHSAPGWTFI